MSDLSPTEQLEAYRKLMRQQATQLEYYREFAPDIDDVNVAPPGYFSHQIGNLNWAAGYLRAGHLQIIEQGLDTEEEAVAIAWRHYHQLHGKEITMT